MCGRRGCDPTIWAPAAASSAWYNPSAIKVQHVWHALVLMVPGVCCARPCHWRQLLGCLLRLPPLCLGMTRKLCRPVRGALQCR